MQRIDWFIWNPSNCECECDVGEYLDCENCKCRIRLVDKLVEECTENVEEVNLAGITSTDLLSVKNENKHKCSSVHCVIFNNLYNQHWNWYLFCLPKIHES